MGFKVAADGCPNRRVLAKSNIDRLERNVLLAAQMPSAATQAEGRKTENETAASQSFVIHKHRIKLKE